MMCLIASGVYHPFSMKESLVLSLNRKHDFAGGGKRLYELWIGYARPIIKEMCSAAGVKDPTEQKESLQRRKLICIWRLLQQPQKPTLRSKPSEKWEF